MSENKKSFLPDIIEPVSNAIHQNLPETEKKVDETLATVVDFFNSVVLYPVQKANLTFKYKLEKFKDDMNMKTREIPPENLQDPPIMIAGPILEALRYSYDEEELREMYENLLASAMDNRKVSQVHPSFIDAVRQMSPLDAKLLEKLSNDYRWLGASVSFVSTKSDERFSNILPNFFIPELMGLADPYSISTSINNLSRLGIITIFDIIYGDCIEEEIKQHPFVQTKHQELKKYDKSLRVDVSEKTIELNNYGECFVKVCLGKEMDV